MLQLNETTQARADFKRKVEDHYRNEWGRAEQINLEHQSSSSAAIPAPSRAEPRRDGKKSTKKDDKSAYF